MKEETKLVSAICWYDEKEWNRLKAIDPSGIDDTYLEWRRKANQALKDMVSSGLKVQKVSIKIDDFLRYCKARNVEPNAEARSRYGAELLQKRS